MVQGIQGEFEGESFGLDEEEEIDDLPSVSRTTDELQVRVAFRGVIASSSYSSKSYLNSQCQSALQYFPGEYTRNAPLKGSPGRSQSQSQQPQTVLHSSLAQSRKGKP